MEEEKKEEHYGILSLKDRVRLQNVYCELKSEESDKGNTITGYFILKRFTKRKYDSLQKTKEFKYITKDGLYIEGEFFKKILGQFMVAHFKVTNLYDVKIWGNEKINTAKFYFYNPYILPFGGKEKFGRDRLKGFELKLIKNKTSVKIKDTNIIIKFFEGYNASFPPGKDIIVKRRTHPFITLHFDQLVLSEIEKIVDDVSMRVNDFLLMVSLLLCQRIGSYGYHLDLYDKEDKIVREIIHKSLKKSAGKPFIDNDIWWGDFMKKFTNSNLSSLTSSFSSLEKNPKKNITTIIHKFLTSFDIKIIEQQFINFSIVLESISKMILDYKKIKFECDKKKESCREKLILTACSKMKIDQSYYNFSPSKNSKKVKWYITEIRNDQIHFNYLDIDYKEMYDELRKIIKLSRILIIAIIVPKLKEFPYPCET